MASVPLSAPDPARISDTIRTKLPFRVEFSGLAPLAGDASNRRYFRLQVRGGPPHSLVLMQLASPEGFKQSEEAVSQGAPVTAELPFVNILNHLLKADVAVPALHYYHEATGLRSAEDLCDVALALALQQGTSPDTLALYREAVAARD